MTETKLGGHSGRLWLACALAVTAIAPAQTATETVLHSFGNFPNGANPYGTLTIDSAGDLYGTTYQGGASNAGAVFEREASGTYKVLYSFTGGNDGGNPYAGVTLDAAGTLFGTTYYGGTANVGVVYKVSPAGQETVLYSFSDSVTGNAYYGGYYPYAGLTLDGAGNFYGTTYMGGSGQEGVVYKLSPSGQESVLHSFLSGSGGASHAGLILDAAGNLYGTASSVVYEISAAGQYTAPLYLAIGTTGGTTDAGVAMDASGNLYGTTNPTSSGNNRAPYGVVYKVNTANHLTVLYTFPGPAKTGASIATGNNPGVVLDAAGNVYGGTPNAGGGARCTR